MDESLSDLQGLKTLYDQNINDLNFKSMYSSFSMLIWGLIMAKAKAGYTAASSKDHASIKSQCKNVFFLVALVAVACFAQYKYESSASTSLQEASPPKGRNLAMEMYDTEDVVEAVDYRDLLKKAKMSWERQEKKKLAAPKINKPLTKMNLPKKIDLKSFNQVVRNFSEALMTIVFFGGCFSYAYMFKKYHDAVEKHQNLTSILNNPQARVATAEQAQSILGQLAPQVPAKSFEQRKDELIRALQSVAPVVQEQKVRVTAPTLNNLPPSARNEDNFNYSLCESIDYQRESLQAPLIETKAPQVLFTQEQVQDLLAKQKEELRKQIESK